MGYGHMAYPQFILWLYKTFLNDLLQFDFFEK